MKTFLLLATLVVGTLFSTAQNSYFVFFKDKDGSTFEPLKYFDAKAIERKILFGIPIADSTDFPVSDFYLQKTTELSTKIGYESRWFNGIYVWATDVQIQQIQKLSFVKDILRIESSGVLASKTIDSENSDNEPTQLAVKQLNRMQGDLFQQQQINGKGIRIAIFDGGFPEVDKHKAFEHIRREQRIIKTYDFTKKKEFVYSYNSHGLSTFSNIAGIYDSIPLGLATGAEFLLARTEVNSEPFAEEQYWLAAAEWADKNGAHIISSSLGYTKDRYFPEQMDGTQSLVCRAANMAARKGMLVVNAMGNDGDNDWKVVGTPADADSIISVGGIDPTSDYHINFSSFGPTKDGRLKPNVTAYGKATVASQGQSIKIAYGTSFATPLISGFAACAWQTMMGKTNMEMKSEIEHSGERYPYFDYAHGYGVPQASYFLNKTKSENKSEAFRFDVDHEKVSVIYLSALDSLQTKMANDNSLTDYSYSSKASIKASYYLYYHIAKPDGKLSRYGVVVVYSENPISIDLSEIPAGYTLRISYKNKTQEWSNNTINTLNNK